ncbi:MAG: carboxypeptidase regulatory-like domain-containing protein [Bacteroidia bacterium]|nr:carboxypeptidase regulatory-like domain-containing protein [Bacteroidia bacterium]
MTKDQEDILNMYEATADVLQTHNSVWSSNVPFSAAVAELNDNIDDIGDLRDQQETDTTGVTDDKDLKRKTLEDQTYTAASIIIFYASTNNKRELLKKVSFNRSALSKARDNELPGMSDQVHQAAADNALAVLPFGWTALMTSDLGTAINDYVDYISKPRAALSETSAATEELPKVYDATTKLLEERLDKGMELYRVTKPDFYAQYFNARIIVNSPTLKRALQVQFVDDATGKPIAHVRVTVDTTIHRRSSKKGNIRVQNLTEGAHQFKTSIPGYADTTRDFNVISGETTKMEIRLVKV